MPIYKSSHTVLLSRMESDTMKNLLLKQSPPTMGPKRQNMLFYRFLSTMILFSGIVFVVAAFLITDIRELVSGGFVSVAVTTLSTKCEQRRLPLGAESLPVGIIANTSDLEMRPLWGSPPTKQSPMSLLAMAVGLKQKDNVVKIVGKFISSNFAVMLLHYDGNVDGWKDVEWHDRVIHVSAPKQTKWWFAKRFLHPDIVAEYSYIFLWDEDLGVEHFNVDNYLSIIQKEGLDISQPAIDSKKSRVQHPFTARDEGTPTVHRSIAKKYYGYKKCFEHSRDPPCAGWVEIMAPVICKASWRCVWYMLQNDFVHMWGLDFLMGYCAQGDRFQRVGIVDAEYIVHYGVPSLGGSGSKPESTALAGNNASSVLKSARRVMLASDISRERRMVRRQSNIDMRGLYKRWNQATIDDECWTDPYQKTN